MSLLAVALIINHRQAFPELVWWLLVANFAVVALALYDTMGRVVYGVFMRWSVTTINFLAVVASLMYLRVRRVC
jgi:hypothetical protein